MKKTSVNTPTTPTPTERLNAIVEQGLCIGCGLCQSIAGKDKVMVKKTAEGYEQPVVTGDLDHATVDKIYDTCPGTRVEGLPVGQISPHGQTDNVWGEWVLAQRAWASDTRMRFEGATGGVLTALASYLLSSQRVNFVLHVKASTLEPTFGERHLSFTQAQVMEAAGSRYGPAAVLLDINDILDRGDTFAFIGKPCDIAALRNYARHDCRVNELVRYWLTPVCGGFMPPPAMNDFLQRQNIKREEVTAFRYRGHGCPGPTRIETKSGTKEYHYLDFWGEDESQWSLPFRCKICPDGIGEAADIAAMDTWAGGSPRREETDADPGVNAVIARTDAGVELLRSAARDGALTLEKSVTPDDLSFYQMHQMRKKYAVWARYQGLQDAGRIVPSTARLRLEELAQEMPAEFNEQERRGARRRAQRRARNGLRRD